MGRDLAALARGARDDATVFPLTPLRPLPWHRTAPSLVQGLTWLYRLHDAVDEARFLRAAV